MALSTKSEVLAATLKKLSESGLTAADMETLGIACKMDREAEKLTGYTTPGFLIPYFDTKGSKLPFWRYRRFERRTGRPAHKKGCKYFQPKDSGVFVYFPPNGKWRKIIKDANMPLFITEGELKAACATKYGFPTIGLGGVWSFKSKKKGVEFLPELEAFAWQGRSVYIVYDSDAMTNAKVMEAECALAKELLKRGARPHAVRLPSLGEEGKTGVDDFIMHESGGVEALRDVVASTAEWSKSAALHEFNREVIFIRDPGVCVIRATGQRVDARNLVSPLYANRLYQKPAPTENNPLKTVETSVPADWLKWDGRAEASKITYAPGQPIITDKREYNMWRGWGTKPKKGNIKPWTTLLNYIFKDNSMEERTWFEKWCAYPIQFPGTKMYSACVLWSTAQGTGKTLVGYTLGQIYGDNFMEIGDTELSASFNGWAVNRQFVLGDEITGNGGGEKRQLANRLKSMITQQSIKVNQKYVPEYNVPDCINYLWTSNHCDAFFLENLDRRYFVIEIKGAPMPLKWYRTVYDKWLKGNGPAALMHHFMKMDLDGFDPHAPAPMTESKKTMIEEGRSDIADWVENLPMHPQAKMLMTSEEIVQVAIGAGKTQWTKNGISRALHAAGYIRPLGDQQQLLLDDGRQVRPWLIKRQAVDPTTAPRTNRSSRNIIREYWYSDRKPAKELSERKFRKKKGDK